MIKKGGRGTERGKNERQSNDQKKKIYKENREIDKEKQRERKQLIDRKICIVKYRQTERQKIKKRKIYRKKFGTYFDCLNHKTKFRLQNILS